MSFNGFLKGVLEVLAPKPPDDPTREHCGRVLGGCIPPHASPQPELGYWCGCACVGCAHARQLGQLKKGMRR